MKKSCHILTTVLLCLALTGCRHTEVPAPGPAEPKPPAVETPVTLERLEIEITRDGQEATALMAALREMPEQLREALAEQDVPVERIAMTVGASPEATVRAVLEGGVDLAFLPADTFAALEQPPELLLAGGGGQALICASSSEYGINLSNRENWTWEELDRARWGVTETALRALDLWLSDHYRGNTTEDLFSVTVYETEEALRSAAERGEVDLLALEGEAGDFSVLTATERLYEMVVVAAEAGPLTEPGVASALADALAELDSGLFGGVAYEVTDNAALNPQRRALTIE